MRLLAAVALVLVVVTACGEEDTARDTMEGIVVAVDGDLSSVASFTVVDDNGTSFTFIPADGLTFHDGPLSHLTAHLTSGEPIRVGYETSTDGTLTAVSIDDA